MRHGPASTGLGLAGIGAGLLVFLADCLEWGISPFGDAILIVAALALVAAGIGYVGHALLAGEKAKLSEIDYAVDGHSGLWVRTHTTIRRLCYCRSDLKTQNPLNVEGSR